MAKEDIVQILRNTARELRVACNIMEEFHHFTDLDIGQSVPRLSARGHTALEFQQQFVARNKPVVLTDAVEHWPALKLWSANYLTQRVGDVKVTVAVTPNGRADAVTECEGRRVFALPLERRMTVRALLEGLQDSSHTLYAQRQNSSLSEEFSELLPDVGPLPTFAEAFGAPPEATNIWIGDNRSVSSWHKDPYENLYAVVRGTKVFLLLPPVEAYRLHVQRFPVHEYAEAGGGLVLLPKDPPESVPWSPVDPCPPPEQLARAAREFPLFFDPAMPQPLKVILKEGEVLYLPSLWQHHVRQESSRPGEPVIAVNVWFDMAMDCKFAYAKAFEDLAAYCVGQESVVKTLQAC